MNYLILIKGNPATAELFAAMSDDERRSAYQTYFDVSADLQRSGELVDSNALDQTHQRIVRRGADSPVVTDAPLPELTEIVTGYYLVDVADEARAAEIAARFPEAAVDDGIRIARTLMGEDLTAMGM